MLKKGSKLYSILTGTCPKCHNGPMYVARNPYLLGTTVKMHERCPHCNFKYKVEPSFFYGAMYVSYGVGVAVAVAAFVISYLILGLGLKASFIAIVLTLVFTMPLIIRISRNIWINIFVSYDPQKAQ
ncbi:MAG: DUF983 domain-containing protein [Capnocytophaga sp.]|nr:DUF983 domain-containing protein [Capnocytophaga sp.]